jgi:hypothetical protein
MPKKTYFQVTHILSNQPLFDVWEEGRPASKRHFVRQLSFMESDIFHDLTLRANNLPTPKEKPWLDLFHECGAVTDGDGELAEPGHRRRRRRRRRQ